MTGKKFIGSFKGKFNETNVSGGKIDSIKGKAELTISEVGKGAYLITVVEDNNTTFNHLAYLQEDHILMSEAQTSQGITSTYFNKTKK